MSIFVSVVTVVRNAERELRVTAASLAKQEFRDFEWVIIDGASGDQTKQFVQEQISAGNASGISEPDRGIYDAMNKGLTLSKGDYILFLNAGDCLLDSVSLKSAAREMQGAGLPDIGFFGSIMDFGNHRFVRPAKKPSYIWHGQPGLHQATFVRCELHKQFPFNTKYQVIGDYEALARMVVAGASMMSFETILGINDFNACSMSGSHKGILIRDAALVQREVLHLPYWWIAASAARRSVNSIFFKMLTALRDRRAG